MSAYARTSESQEILCSFIEPSNSNNNNSNNNNNNNNNNNDNNFKNT